MEVIKVIPRGYCKGVVRAISLAKQATIDYPNQPIYVLGMLVHNQYIVDALSSMGIQTITDTTKTKLEILADIKEGVVIFTAHGIDPACVSFAKAKGLTVIDATCPDVLKTQALVKAKIAQGYEILYIGKPSHPEAEAVCAMDSSIHLITKISDIDAFIHQDKVFVTNQTTMSFQDIEAFFKHIQQRIPQAKFSQEICNATRIRQVAVASLKDIDILFVVGDIASNNSNRLVEIAQANDNIRQVQRINECCDIDYELLKNAKRVAITSGASTPTYLTNQVITYLENYEYGLPVPKIDIQKML